MNKPIVEVVAGVLFNHKNEVLLASRPNSKSFAGFWEFPGGKIEANETAHDAIIREFFEETGLEVQAAYSWLYQVIEREDAVIKLQFMRIYAQNWSGTLIAKEKQLFSWQNPNEISVAPILPNNADVINALRMPLFLSGSLKEGLSSSDERQQIVALPKSRIHLDENAFLLADCRQTYMVDNPNKRPFVAIVDKPNIFHQVQDAQAIIWTGYEKDLIKLLRHGVSLPVFFNQTIKDSTPLKSYIHGLVDFKNEDKDIFLV